MANKRTKNRLDTIEDQLSYQRWCCGYKCLNKYIA